MYISANEILSKYKSKLGDEFGLAYYHAHAEWCDLWLTWKQFRTLFCSGPERVELLNRCGSDFFYRVDKLFFESTILAICRLTDNEKVAGRPTLSVRAFLKFMSSDEQKEVMRALIQRVNESVAFARDWRNRRISHNDLALITGEALPLEVATIDLVSRSITSLYNVFSYISTEFMGTGISDDVIDALNNENVTLDRLYLGDLEFSSELKALRSGQHYERERPGWLTKLAD